MTPSLLLFPVLAQEAPAPADTGAQQMIQSLVIFGAIGAIFWFLIIRPQQKQEKQRRAMLSALKKRDRVLTSGGVFGSVADLREDEVTLLVCENPPVKIRVQRSSVVEILQDGTPAGAPAS